MKKYDNLTAALSDILKSRDDVTIFGVKAFYTIDENKIAEIVLRTGGTVDHYTRLQVTIQHKDNGDIATNSFMFQDYLEPTPASLAHPNSDMVHNMHIWRNREIDWYILEPKSTKPIVDAIFEYIEIYS
jgi:hypothetical protein